MKADDVRPRDAGRRRERFEEFVLRGRGREDRAGAASRVERAEQLGRDRLRGGHACRAPRRVDIDVQLASAKPLDEITLSQISPRFHRSLPSGAPEARCKLAGGKRAKRAPPPEVDGK